MDRSARWSCSSSIRPGSRPTRFKERSKTTSEENSPKQAVFITFFRQIQSHGGVADGIADSLLAVRDLDFDSPHITQLREAIRSRLEVYTAYMDRTMRATLKKPTPGNPQPPSGKWRQMWETQCMNPRARILCGRKSWREFIRRYLKASNEYPSTGTHKGCPTI